MRNIRLLLLTALLALPLAACARSREPTTSPTASAPAPPVAPTTSPTPAGTVRPTTGPTRPTPTRPQPGRTTAVPRSLLGQDVERIPTTRKVIALTFDAGANADAVSSILATLDREGVSATFFLTGNFVTAFPTPSRQIATAGHRIGDHSLDHPHFTQLSDAQIRAQVRDAAAAIQRVTGTSPAPLFRFPYGARTTHTIAVVNATGYLPVRWTVDSLGWQGTMNGSRDAAFVADRVLSAAAAGGIVLMHVGSHPSDHSTLDADALPATIAGLRARGYSFVTLDALLA